jgi:response regulator NasT
MSLRVLLVDESDERAALLAEALARDGYQVIKRVKPGETLMTELAGVRPDLIVIDMESPSRDVLEDVQTIGREQPCPVVLFARDGDEEKIRAAIGAGVSAYVVDGLSSRRVKPILDAAIARFQQFQALQEELKQAKASLADRKTIERAKGILMKRNQCGEEEAYQTLRKLAMSSNQRLVEVAEKVVEVAELFRS